MHKLNPEFKIGEKTIGHNHPTFIVAEACDNHLGNMNTAREMIRFSKLAGASAVKFQYHLPDEEMLPDTPMSDNMAEPLYEFLKKYALTLDQHIELKAYCDVIGIQYMCTPFSLQSAIELHDAHLLDVIKIGSGEMTDIPSLTAMAAWGIPMILSTGMCTFDEIQETYDAMLATKTPFALMNCISEYPPLYSDINLGVIKEMQQRFNRALIGHSDHTPTLYTSYAAVTLGASIIEKHVIINKLQPGPDQAVSIDFYELAELVRGIRIIEAASGNDKKVHHREHQIRAWAHRSIVTKKPLFKGDIITGECIWSKRPGTGIPAKHRDEIIGRKLRHDVAENVLLSWDDMV